MPASLVITGNTNDALAAIAKLERQYDSLENKIKRLGQASKQAGDDGGFRKMAQGATQFAQQLTGVASGVDLIFKGIQAANKEWQDFINREEKAKDANVQFAQTLTRLSLATDMPMNDAKAMIMRLSEQHNVSLKDVPEMLNRMQASKGPTQTQAEVEKAFAAAARIGNLDIESMSQLGETSLDITKQIKGATAEQAMGFSLAAQAQSRVADPAAFNKNVIPAVLGGNKIAGTPLEYGVALSNALTHGSGDTTGKRSNTAQVGLEMQLLEMLPEYGSTPERIEAIRNDPALRDAIMHGKNYKGKDFKGIQTEFIGPDGQTINMDSGRLSGERRMMPAIEALLTKGSAEEGIMNATLRDLPSLDKADAEFNRRAKAYADDPNIQIAQKNLRSSNMAEAKRINDLKGATGGVARKTFEEQMETAGIGYFHRNEATWGKFFREKMQQSPEEAAINTARAEANAYRGRNNPELADKFERVARDLETSFQGPGKPAGGRADERLQEATEKQTRVLEEIRDGVKEQKKRPLGMGNKE